MNRVNPAEGGGARPREDQRGAGKSARQAWTNIEALKGLLARADCELAREPGGYVAVAAVGGDKREEQVGRWGWAGSRDAGGRVAVLGNGLVAGARGIRVRVHREGGGLLGSALMRRVVAPVPETERAEPSVSNPPGTVTETGRLAAVEALLARVLAHAAAQDREITALKGTIAGMGPVRESMGNFDVRLEELEAVAHRHGGGDGDEDESVGDEYKEADEDEGADEDEVDEDEVDE